MFIDGEHKMKKKYLKWALVIAWAIIIFLFSNQTGDVSNNNNRFVVDLFKLVGVNLDSYFGGMIDFIIRKLAHFLEYFIFYYLIYNALVENTSRKSALITSLVIVFIYACSDEIHQAFIPGRGPAIRDVLVDTGGGLLCMILNILWRT
jgi:VanZ family protein